MLFFYAWWIENDMQGSTSLGILGSVMEVAKRDVSE
jgi:hypothetical protein